MCRQGESSLQTPCLCRASVATNKECSLEGKGCLSCDSSIEYFHYYDYGFTKVYMSLIPTAQSGGWKTVTSS